MIAKVSPPQYILGLDLGPSSIGWAVIALENGEPAAVAAVKITAAGVRRFEAGVQGDIEAGRDESRATQRRDARSPRRQTWRRQYHLSQRRGYQSNRKAAKEDDDRGVVKQGISELAEALSAAGPFLPHGKTASDRPGEDREVAYHGDRMTVSDSLSGPIEGSRWHNSEQFERLTCFVAEAVAPWEQNLLVQRLWVEWIIGPPGRPLTGKTFPGPRPTRLT